MLNLQLTAPPAHETPVKRNKNNHQEPLTAESDLPPTRSLADLDPELLFHNFAQLVQVSQDEEAFEDDFEDEVARTLDYDHPHTLRLDFEPKTSSMKKKPLPKPSQASSPAINLFPVLSPPTEPVEMREESYSSPLRAQRVVREGGSWAARKGCEES